MNKPSNWYNMDQYERREWQQAESERDDLEYQARSAQEDAEQARRDASREIDRIRRQTSANSEETEYILEGMQMTIDEQAERITQLEARAEIDTGAIASLETKLAAAQATQIAELREALLKSNASLETLLNEEDSDGRVTAPDSIHRKNAREARALLAKAAS